MGVIKLDLHFRKMQIQTFEQFHERSLGELFGNAGGLLGFWLGGSIVAFIHLLSLCVPKGRGNSPACRQSCKNCGKQVFPATNSPRIAVPRKTTQATEAVSRFFNETPLHGFGYFENIEGTNQRLFWAAIVGICTGFFFLQGLQAVVNYALDLPATTYSVDQRLEMQLPNAIVCLPGHFSLQRVADMRLGKEFTEHLLRGFVMSKWAETPSDDDVLTHGDVNLTTYKTIHNVTYPELAGNLTPSVFEIFGGCRHSIRVNCSKIVRKLWYWPGSRFEVTSPKQIRGLPIGLRFNVYPNGHYNLTGKVKRTNDSEKPQPMEKLLYPGFSSQVEEGVYLFLSDNGTIEARHMFLSPGTVAMVSLAPRRILTLSNRKYKCGKYHYDVCVSSCITGVKVGDCPCTPIDAYGIDDSNRPICDPVAAIRCQARAERLRGSMRSTAALSRCITTKCHQGCARTEYRRTITSLPWNDTFYIYASENKEGQRIEVNLLYETMNLLILEQFYSTTFGDLIGTLGGHSGLWLGGSVIALVHFLKFWLTAAFNGIIAYWTGRRRRNRQRQSSW